MAGYIPPRTNGKTVSDYLGCLITQKIFLYTTRQHMVALLLDNYGASS